MCCSPSAIPAIGMDAETQSHLFEPFFTTKEQGKGTGLGLSTVYGIVKQSGGSIGVYSEPGRGTTFKIYLPRVEQAVTEATSRIRRDASRRRDGDDPAGRGRAAGPEPRRARSLRVHGYTVLEARHGIEALRSARTYAGPIHLLLTDVVMPQMSGPEVAEELQIVRPGAKVLYMSGYPDHPVFDQGGVSRETGFLAEPFSPQVLAKKVREVLDGVKAA